MVAPSAGLPSDPFDVQPGPQDKVIPLLPGEIFRQGRLTLNDAVEGTPQVATAGVPYDVRVVVTDQFFNIVDAPPGTQVRLTTTDPDDVEPPFEPVVGSEVTLRIRPSEAATLFIPEIDDEVLVAFEAGDPRCRRSAAAARRDGADDAWPAAFGDPGRPRRGASRERARGAE